jgi:hypothetical protein
MLAVGESGDNRSTKKSDLILKQKPPELWFIRGS